MSRKKFPTLHLGKADARNVLQAACGTNGLGDQIVDTRAMFRLMGGAVKPYGRNMCRKCIQVHDTFKEPHEPTALP